MLEAFVDTPQRHKHVSVFPVIAPQGPVLPYLLSTEIQGSDVLTLRETEEVGAPMILARNNSLHALLIVGGEPLPGAQPGRLMERSILLAGKSVTQLPASPVERGGWVSAEEEAEITQWLQEFPIQAGQVGILVYLGDRLLGLEALGAPNLYAPLHRRLLIRFVKEAMARTSRPTEDRRELTDKARKLVDAIEGADRVATKRVGVGEHWALTGTVFGTELIYRGHLVHLSVRPEPTGAFREAQTMGSG